MYHGAKYSFDHHHHITVNLSCRMMYTRSLVVSIREMSVFKRISGVLCICAYMNACTLWRYISRNAVELWLPMSDLESSLQCFVHCMPRNVI